MMTKRSNKEKIYFILFVGKSISNIATMHCFPCTFQKAK